MPQINKKCGTFPLNGKLMTHATTSYGTLTDKITGYIIGVWPPNENKTYVGIFTKSFHQYFTEKMMKSMLAGIDYKWKLSAPSSSGLGRETFNLLTGVRLSSGSQFNSAERK